MAIVDDDLWVREGRATALRAEGIDVALTLSPDDALDEDAGMWSEIGLVVVDAKDERADFDLYVGVRVVEHLRTVVGDHLRIVVITGHVLDDVLRLRMAEAGADWLYGHSDVRTPEELARIVFDPGSGPVAPKPSDTALEQAGLSADARPNEALRYLQDADLHGAVESTSVGESQKALLAGRRRLINARQRLAPLLGTTPSDPRATTPEWRRIVAVVDRVRGRGPDVPR